MSKTPAKKKPATSAKPAKSAKAKGKPGAKAPPRAGAGKRAPDVAASDPSLFDPLTPGEIADALRTLTEDRRLSSMAKVGRYRVICTEPLVVKPPHWMAGHRLARVVIYDYAADRTVDACIDLAAGVVAHLALISLLEDRDPPKTLASFDVEDSQRRIADRGGLGGVA